MLYISKKQKIILIGVVSATLIGLLFYFTIGKTYFENQKIANIESRVDGFIENKYTNSIKENVTVDEVSSIQKDIDQIEDTSKKTKLQNKVQSVIDQAKLQSDLKAQIKKFSEAEELNQIKIEDLKSSISQAQSVLNQKVRNELIKNGNEILDKVEYATYVLSEANRITNDNPGLYYSVQGLNDSVYYSDTKKEVDKILEKSKKEIELQKSSSDAQKNAQKNAALQEAQRGSTYSFTKGSSTSTKMKSNEYQIFNKVSNNKSIVGQKFLGIEGNKLIVYSTELSSGTVSVKEIVTIEVTNSKISSPQVFNTYSIQNGIVNADNFTIGTQQSNDVTLSVNGLETLKNSIR